MLTSALSSLNKGDGLRLFQGQGEFATNGTAWYLKEIPDEPPPRVLIMVTAVATSSGPFSPVRVGDVIGVSPAEIEVRS